MLPGASPATANWRGPSKDRRGTDRAAEGGDIETLKASRGVGCSPSPENFEILPLEEVQFGAFSCTFKLSINLLQLPN